MEIGIELWTFKLIPFQGNHLAPKIVYLTDRPYNLRPKFPEILEDNAAVSHESSWSHSWSDLN